MSAKRAVVSRQVKQGGRLQSFRPNHLSDDTGPPCPPKAVLSAHIIEGPSWPGGDLPGLREVMPPFDSSCASMVGCHRYSFELSYGLYRLAPLGLW